MNLAFLRRLARFTISALLVAGSMALVLGNLAPLGARWTRICDQACHFKMQSLLAAGVLGLLLWMLRREWRVLRGVVFAVLVINLWQVAPWLPWGGSGNVAAKQQPVQVTVFNVLHRNRHYDEAVEYLAAQNSDVLVLLEVNMGWFAACNRLRQAGYTHIVRTRSLGSPGIAVYSRQPILSTEEVVFSPEGFSDLKVVLELEGRPVTLYASHPRSPVHGPNSWQLRNTHLARLAEAVEQTPGPVIVAADLNCTMWSPFYDTLTRAGLENARRGHGVSATWPAPYARLSGIPIDHVLYSRHFTCAGCEAGPALGSDHLPITARLALPLADDEPPSSIASR